MNISFFSLEDDQTTTLKSVLLLRLVVVSLCFTAVIIWHLSYQAIDFIGVLSGLFCLVFTWSLWQHTQQKPTTNTPFVILREGLLDFIWVTLFVFFSGGSSNPFVYYYLVLIALAAAIFTTRQAWVACAVCIISYTCLILFDVQAHFSHFNQNYQLHLIGMWFNFVGSALVVCLFVSTLIQLASKHYQTSLKVQQEIDNNEKILSLATVSATTIHELASPLSTLKILAQELQQTQSLPESVRNDITLIDQQVARCQKTMAELSSFAEHANQKTNTHVTDLVHQIDEHVALQHPTRQLSIRNLSDSQCVIVSSPLLSIALINLINNALEANDAPPKVEIVNDPNTLTMAITNKTDDSVERIFARWGTPHYSGKEDGLGIGSLLANSTINQHHGTVELEAIETEDKRINTYAVSPRDVRISIQFPLVVTLARPR